MTAIDLPSAPAVTGPPAPNPNIVRLLNRLQNVRVSGHGQWMACCPAHDDRNPSLSIGEVDGRVLLHCFVGCDAKAILAAVGLTFADLNSSHNPIENVAAAAARRAKGTVEGTWTYVDAEWQPVLAVVRLRTAEGKTYRPFHLTDSGWEVGDPPGPLPLYHLPELARHPCIYVVEGEKAADAAWSIGLPATTSAHGAQSPNKTDWRPLAGRDVIILPDNDRPGSEYAQKVTEILRDLNAQHDQNP